MSQVTHKAVYVWRVLAAALLSASVLSGCGGGSGPAPATIASEAADDGDGDSFGICRMLTTEQVASVLPGHDGGMVTSAGGSLIEGVDSYQCSYTAMRESDVDLLTVVVTIAPDDALYEQIKPSGFAFDDEDAIDVGNGGWVKDDVPGEFGVVAKKNRAVLRLDLMAGDAQGKSAEMLTLAQAVAAKL